MNLLLHTCCAPCSVYCIDSLRKENIEPTVYWYNPNIHPYMEYKARRDCLKEYTKSIEINAIFEEDYGLDEFCKNVSNALNTRCVNYCYPVRLRKTFEYAKQNGFDSVSTTLLYSIYQKHDFIKAYCEKLAKEYGIEFLYRDFRDGFWVGHDKARELGLYMQKYCGCIFSEEMRYYNRNATKPSIPNGYKIPREPRLQVKKIENKDDYIDLLLEADPSKDMIHKYLDDSDVYALKKEDELISIAVILHIDRKTLELKNIVTTEKYRNKGYGTEAIKLILEYGFKYMNLHNIKLDLMEFNDRALKCYEKCGFKEYGRRRKCKFINGKYYDTISMDVLAEEFTGDFIRNKNI